MRDGAQNRISTGKAAWMIGLIFFGWLAFLFVPFPWGEKLVPAPKPVAAESRLQSVGLSDNVDWEGLPEFFAVWADEAVWVNDKALFAYWNPGSKSYSYYFEAIRENGKVRFRHLSKSDLAKDGLLSYDQLVDLTDGIDSESDILTHPFVFPEPLVRSKGNIPIIRSGPMKPIPASLGKPHATVDVNSSSVGLPEPDSGKLLKDDDRQKK